LLVSLSSLPLTPKFVIHCARIWDYNHLTSLSGRLQVSMLISVIIWSSALGLFGLLYPKQVGGVQRLITNHPNIDIKSQILPQTVMFDLPLKPAMKDNKNQVVQDSLKQLLAQADSYLTKKATSVMEKKQIPPSGNKHDFLSLAPYRWPDLTKPNHMPYVYRDGQINPEVYTIPDGGNMDEMIKRVKTLSIAYYFTDNISYASKASELLRIWFLNNNTRMNPNLQYTEVILGRNNGSHSGIIAGNNFPDIIDSIALISGSSAWTAQDQQGIESWFDKYLEWLLNSDAGKEERNRLNNHGTWYNVQASSIAFFLNKTEITRDIVKHSINQLAAKIRPDGSQPFELQRRTSLNYHIINLLGLFNQAKIADRIGIDIWDYKTAEGSGLQNALDYLLPYALKKEIWPYKQIKPIDTSRLTDLLCQATIHYGGNESYKESFRSVISSSIVNEANSPMYECIIKAERD
jgi:hypothetical protein